MQKSRLSNTYIFSNNPTVTGNDSSIVVADFPKKEGLTIDSGGWTDVQFPKLSPDSTKVAYIKKESWNNGYPKYGIMVYDILSKQTQRYADEEDKVYLLNIAENKKSKLN